MEMLIQWIERMEDVRQKAKVKHNLVDILIIVLFATLCNANEWEEIADFALYHQEMLKKYISLENGIPSHDTIRRVMGMIKPEYLQQLYSTWNDFLNTDNGEKLKKIICIDGKTVCKSKQNEQKAKHIVSAWSDEDGFCLGQKAIDEKSNEITAIPKLLECINIKNHIITIDAMGTQTLIAEHIKKCRADYVLAVKENQKTLYDNISEYLNDDDFKRKIKDKGNYLKTTEKAHNQIETREYYQTSTISWMENKQKWKGLKSIGMIEKTIEKDGKITVEKRYYISSLGSDINMFAKAVRKHWSVEVMHWHLDVTFREDYNTTIDKIAVQNQNIIRKWCLSILKLLQIGNKKISLKRKRFILSMKPDKFIEQILEL